MAPAGNDLGDIARVRAVREQAVRGPLVDARAELSRLRSVDRGWERARELTLLEVIVALRGQDFREADRLMQVVGELESREREVFRAWLSATPEWAQPRARPLLERFLQACEGSEPWAAPESERGRGAAPPRRWGRGWITATAVVTLALVLLGWWAWPAGQRESLPRGPSADTADWMRGNAAPSLADILPQNPASTGVPAAPASAGNAGPLVPPPPPPVVVAPSSAPPPPPVQVVAIGLGTPPDPAPAPASVPPAPAAPRVGEGTTAQPAAPTVGEWLSFSRSDLEELERLCKASERSYPWLLRSYTVKRLAGNVTAAMAADRKASSRIRLSTSNVDEALAMCDAENSSLENDQVARGQIRQDLSLLADRIKRAAKDGKSLVGPLESESWPRAVDKRVQGLSASKPTPAERAQLLVDVVGVCLAMDMAFVIQQLDVGTAFDGTRRTSALRQYASDYQQIAKIMGTWRLDVMRKESGAMDPSFWKSIPWQDKNDQSPMTPLEIFDALVAKVLGRDAGGAQYVLDPEAERLVLSVRSTLEAHLVQLRGVQR